MYNIITYDIFHDECKEDGFWHSFIFIPRITQQKLFNMLMKPRNHLGYFRPIHFTNVQKKTKEHSEKVRLIKSWVSILYFALQEQKINADLYLGHKTNKPVYEKITGLDQKIGTKLVVLREKDNLKQMFSKMSYSKKVEATFKMGLKGGCHYLFDKNIRIGNIYVDHPEKNFNKYHNSLEMINRFKIESREHITFKEDSKIIPIDKREYIEREPVSEFMQLADISVGAIRTQALQDKNVKLRYTITEPLTELFEKDVKNKARMNNSRFKNSFSLSNAWIENDIWQFETMKIREEKKEEEPSFFE